MITRAAVSRNSMISRMILERFFLFSGIWSSSPFVLSLCPDRRDIRFLSRQKDTLFSVAGCHPLLEWDKELSRTRKRWAAQTKQLSHKAWRDKMEACNKWRGDMASSSHGTMVIMQICCSLAALGRDTPFLHWLSLLFSAQNDTTQSVIYIW